MKSIFYSFLLCSLGVVGFLQSCERKEDAFGRLSPYITIEDLRQVYKSQDVDITPDKVNEAKWTTGVVISDISAGNVPEGMIIVQQVQNGSKLHGIGIHVGDLAANYHVGDSLMINLSGKTLRKETFLYIDGVTEADLEFVTRVNKLYSRQVTASSIYQRPNEFESTLVKIGGGEIYPEPVAGEKLTGTKRMINGADTLYIKTLPTASFASMDLPKNVNVSGLLLGDKDGLMAVWPNGGNAVEDISDPEIPGDLGDMPLVFTGYCADPEGGDGNYEYMQLMANTDIDFSEIPFSVVTTNNAGANQPNAGAAPGAGWATGGARTMKFNLTEGSVKKGDFFYVGGHQKRISGANSTSLSGLNWIRAFAYSSMSGDGLGDANANILANSGNASGMALFVGTNINEASVPLDVVFFGGTGTSTIIDSVNNLGYRIPNNDHYKRFHQETLNPQPFFSVGSNQYRIPHFLPANVGFFIQLGGVFDADKRIWETPRGFYALKIEKDSPAEVLTTGAYVTKQVNQ